MSTFRGCAESNVEFPNMALSQDSGLDTQGTVNFLTLIKGKVDTDTKFGVGIG